MIRVDCEDCGCTIQTRHEKHPSLANIDVFFIQLWNKTNTKITNKARNRQTNADQEQIQLILERINLCNESFVEKSVDKVVTHFSFPTFEIYIYGDMHKSFENSEKLISFYVGKYTS